MRFNAWMVGLLACAGSNFMACKPQQENPARPEVTGTYFSVRQLILDQVQTYYGQPFVFIKVVREGDRTDSSFVAADTMAWAPVFDAFAQADISDTALVGRYRYSEFEEPATGQHMFLYEASEPDLKTRQLMIGADVFTGKILSLYMDVRLPDGKNQKLYYAPLRLIQIQSASGSGSGAQNLKVEYFFPREEIDDEGVMIP